MYSQQRLVQNAEEQLYFRHAPPVLERQLRLDTYPGKSPKVPFKGAKGWQCSVYYFWWRFLRENEAFRSRQHDGEDSREGRVAYDFRHAHGMNFPNWWVQTLRKQHPDHWQDLLRQGNEHPPMVLRVNQRCMTGQAYLDILTAEGRAAQAQEIAAGFRRQALP